MPCANEKTFRARNAEGALQQYLFNGPRHQIGTGEGCMYFSILDDFRYEQQEISVFELASDTDSFW